MNSIEAIIEETELEENSFNVVYSNAVYEHFPTPSTVTAAIARVLLPGGVVFTKTVNWDSYTRDNMGAAWKLLNPGHGHCSLFTSVTLPRFHTNAGLEIVALEFSGVRFSEQSLLNTILKGVLSFMSRKTLRGDRIIVIARKPE